MRHHLPLPRASAALLLAAVLLTGCAQTNFVASDGPVQQPPSFDHSAFDALLSEYVDARGLVDYERLKENEATALTPYLHQLAQTDPSNLGPDAELAFWINAYNALAIKLIVDNYPVKGIRGTVPVFAPGTGSSPFSIPVGIVGGQKRTLDDIEHGIIRPRFVGTDDYDEPRVHFALVCAAMSCPRLRQEAYTGSRLQAQLADQARTFLHDRAKNEIPAGEGAIRVSKIFKWFGGDFGGSAQAKQAFMADYFEGETRRKLQHGAYDVSYRSYDWTLNDQALAGEDRLASGE